MRAIVRSSVLCALAFSLAACATSARRGESREDQPRTTLEVENRSFLDMTIYVFSGGQRVRLGMARGAATTRFTIPARLIFGATALRFQADPIGGSRTPVSSEIAVTAGDTVTLVIPAH